MEDFMENDWDRFYSLPEVAGRDSEPTARRRSSREGKKNPKDLWGFIWNDEDQNTEATNSHNLSLLAEVTCGFPLITRVSRPRSRVERKKNPLWGFKRFEHIVLTLPKEEKAGFGLKKRKRLPKEEEEWEEPKAKRRSRKGCPNPNPIQPPLMPKRECNFQIALFGIAKHNIFMDLDASIKPTPMASDASNSSATVWVKN